MYFTVIQIISLCTLVRSATKVAVTGAAGRTGSLVFSKLLKTPNVSPLALVRTQSSAKVLYKLGAIKDQVRVCDVTDSEALDSALAGVDSLILCTSAVPKINYLSLAKVLIFKILNKVARPEFSFPPNGDPFNVDWLGAKNQIDAAKKSKVKQFVFLSSMGGSDPTNFLNTIGKKENDEKSGNILLWKRKAEKYLISSGVPYTIIHPGGLLDKKGGEREIIFGVNDELLKEKVRSIPREDVAEVCVQAVLQPNAKKLVFDIISREPGTGVTTTDWKAFFSNKGKYVYEKGDPI